VVVEATQPPEFRVIYERWFEEVSRWIRAMGGPEAEREDLVQDVFLVVHRRLPDFDGENNTRRPSETTVRLCSW